MKTETRAKIQEALGIGYDFIYPYQSIYPSTALDKIRTIREAKTALAAEPDEPTVSKSVEELAEKMTYCYYGENEGITTPSEEYNAQILIQQFLSNRIKKLEEQMKQVEHEFRQGGVEI